MKHLELNFCLLRHQSLLLHESREIRSDYIQFSLAKALGSFGLSLCTGQCMSGSNWEKVFFLLSNGSLNNITASFGGKKNVKVTVCYSISVKLDSALQSYVLGCTESQSRLGALISAVVSGYVIVAYKQTKPHTEQGFQGMLSCCASSQWL